MPKQCTTPPRKLLLDASVILPIVARVRGELAKDTRSPGRRGTRQPREDRAFVDAVKQAMGEPEPRVLSSFDPYERCDAMIRDLRDLDDQRVEDQDDSDEPRCFGRTLSDARYEP